MLSADEPLTWESKPFATGSRVPALRKPREGPGTLYRNWTHTPSRKDGPPAY